MSHILHKMAQDSEEVCYCGDGIWAMTNPIFGILFKDSYGDFVFNKELCMKGGF